MNTVNSKAATSTADRIRTAATNLFYTRGYHATTMRDIAAEVGMKASSLYNHYISKQELLYQIVHSTLHELVLGAQAVAACQVTAEQKLRALIEWHVIFHARNRFRAKVADDQFHALKSNKLAVARRMRRDHEELFKRILASGRQTAGWIVSDVAVVAFAILTAGSSVGKWFREDGKLSAQEVATIYSDFFIAGLSGIPPKTKLPRG